jgi:transcriptional regulator
MHALMRGPPFASLISTGSKGLFASHLPTVLKGDGPYGVIEFHLTRSNPHCRDLADRNEALMISQGPEGYIALNWHYEANTVTWPLSLRKYRKGANIDRPGVIWESPS